MVSFIIPVFNEIENIEDTFISLIKVIRKSDIKNYEIIAVDDGSRDGSTEVLKSYEKKFPNITCIYHSSNKGYGEAVRSGISVSKQPKFTVIPGDNDLSENLLLLMLSHLDDADLILTVPLNKENRTIIRNIISMVYQMIYLLSFKINVAWISGFGIWPTELVKKLGCNSSGFNLISEINVKLLCSGCSYVQIPGYVQAGPKVRSTVTIKNLMEVIFSFSRLFFQVKIKGNKDFNRQPKQKQISFGR